MTLLYFYSSSSSSAATDEAESTTITMDTKHRRDNKISCNSEEDQQEGGADPRVWGSLNTSFKQVQSVLDRNRVLIQQVNDNHQSKIPDNMVKNVALIQEINGNISKVVSLYSDMSTNFSSAFHQQSKNGDVDGDS